MASARKLRKAIIDGHPGNPDESAPFLGPRLKRKFLFRELNANCTEDGAIPRTPQEQRAAE